MCGKLNVMHALTKNSVEHIDIPYGTARCVRLYDTRSVTVRVRYTGAARRYVYVFAVACVPFGDRFVVVHRDVR
jgi:hypothetical protein